MNKKWWWFPFACMIDVVLQAVWKLDLINKDKGDEYMSFLAFRRDITSAIFLKYLKKGILSLCEVQSVKNKAGAMNSRSR